MLHVLSVVTAFSKDQGNLIRNGCPEGICDCSSSWAYTWICDGNVADVSLYGAVFAYSRSADSCDCVDSADYFLERDGGAVGGDCNWSGRDYSGLDSDTSVRTFPSMEEKVRECSNIHDISFLHFILIAVPLVLAEAAGN